MIATRLFHVCPLMVMTTVARLLFASTCTTSSGISSPRLGSGGSMVAGNFTIGSFIPGCKRTFSMISQCRARSP
jgi:hypothetical protein